MILAIYFLFSCNSFSNFLYKLSKITRSLRNESIYWRRCLFMAIASLNFWLALSSLFSRILIYFARELSFSAPALWPPNYCLFSIIFFWKSEICFYICSCSFFSSSILIFNSSMLSPPVLNMVLDCNLFAFILDYKFYQIKSTMTSLSWWFSFLSLSIIPLCFLITATVSSA